MVADLLIKERDLQQTAGTMFEPSEKKQQSLESVSSDIGSMHTIALTHIPKVDDGTGSDKASSSLWNSAANAVRLSMSEDVQRIARSPFAKVIIENLSWLRDNQMPGLPDASPKINRLFSLIQDYVERRIADPFSSYLNALFDGLCSGNRWVDLTSNQYGQIAEITQKLARQTLTDYNKVDKAIAQLEAVGVDTTPYGFEN